VNRILWNVKQLLPLSYVSYYGEHDASYVCVWRMWFGRCFNIRTWQVLREV
jgi:hypothetical protein